MITTNTAPVLLSEREVDEWFDRTYNLSDPAPVEDLRKRLEAHLDLEGYLLFCEYLDAQPELMVKSEDDLLFLVGTLCVLNGQRALWSSIWQTFHNASDGTTQDEFEFLERKTTEARAETC